MRILLTLIALAFLLMVGDCISTYLCLTTPNEHIRAYEANPISKWVFDLIGMVPGLIVMSIGKTLGLWGLYLIYLYSPKRRVPVQCGLAVLALVTAYVNYNNWYILYLLHQ